MTISRMKRIAIAAVVLATFFCVAFVVADALDVANLRHPTQWRSRPPDRSR